jgi:ribosomal protein S18 acetylase RimI-like enzyme
MFIKTELKQGSNKPGFYAVRMYQKIGFEIVDENDEEYIMICRL